MDLFPARLGRHPKHALGGVFVALLQQVFRLFSLNAVLSKLLLQFRPASLECIGNIFQEDQPENDVLIFGGIDRATQLVRYLPEGFGINPVFTMLI